MGRESSSPKKQLRVESLESRLLLTQISLLGASHRERLAAIFDVSTIAAPKIVSVTAATATVTTRIASATETVPNFFDRSALALTKTGTPLRRSRPLTAKPPKSPQGNTVLKPPVLNGTTKQVELSIGGPTNNIVNGLGVNIGSMTAYAQGNAVNNMVTQGGGFELGDGRILVHATSGSTTSQLIVEGSWVWGRLGYSPAVGQQLVGSTGANAHSTWTITNMQDQLDTNGNATGNVVITVAAPFAVAPVATDSFFVQLNNVGIHPLADTVAIVGNATAARDLSIAHGGAASAGLTFGAGSAGANTVRLGYYFGADAGAGRNVFQQGHTYQFSFWAKTSIASSAFINVHQGRNGNSANVALIADGAWHQYTVNVAAANAVVYENGSAEITVAGVNGKVNIDDVKLVDLTDQISATNPLSKQVESLITNEGFSNLRFWIPELRFTNFDDLIGKPQDRKMVIGTGDDYDPQFGLPEMLQLAKDSGASAWIVLPTTFTTQDIHNLMEYLGGDASTVYGAKRIADGHAGSWFADVKGIKFEAGNESWNGTFSPNSYTPFEPYWTRAEEMFHDFKTDSLYTANASKLELIVNGWQWVPWYTQQSINLVPDADAVDISQYTAGPTSDMPINQILGGALSMQMQQQASELSLNTLGKKIYVYEEAAGELGGSITAANESAYATSLGAGLAVIRNAMQLERDYNVSVQNLFTMFQRGDNMANGYALGHYGLFTDLTTSATNPRPVALAAKLMDQAGGGAIYASSLTAGWAVDSTSTISAATTTQASDSMVSFDGHNLVITLFNNTVADLQNTDFHFNLPATLNGKSFTADWANATFNVLNGATVASNNETSSAVTIAAGQYTHSTREVYAALAGHSMGSLVIPIVF